jgi:hypothetical protein
LLTALCTTMRGSRTTSSALRDCHIIPSISSPRTMNGSIGLMRGDPSFRRVPIRQTPVFSNRSNPSTAFANSSQFIAPTGRVRQ